MKLNLDRYNQRIKKQGAEIRELMQQKGESMGITHRANSPSKGSSLEALRDRYRVEDGAINKIAYKVRRSLIYRHKGAGKGHGGPKGSTWLDKYGKQKSTAEASKGKMNTGARKEAPFINEVLESPQGVDELATIAAEELGDALVGNILVK